ncbi:MAG: formylglycine-generating enzyme family protein [Deltaproteobacteria bacterium]|nr:formylglycine-generating enzyme family protein [Deltaproteobacteria bacterium]
MKFVLIPEGVYFMGANSNEEAKNNELPRHEVRISKPFYLGVLEVTQQQWISVMGDNPSSQKGMDNPVNKVSWVDAKIFILRLNRKEGHSRYRLPTEAEWEYAARAGTTSAYYFGDDESKLGEYAWFNPNSRPQTPGRIPDTFGTPQPVGQKPPNAWGLYDILGNVQEWTEDWFGETYYANSPSTDPQGPSSGIARVLRGGSWYSPERFCRSAYRSSYKPLHRDALDGFRLALSVE